MACATFSLTTLAQPLGGGKSPAKDQQFSANAQCLKSLAGSGRPSCSIIQPSFSHRGSLTPPRAARDPCRAASWPRRWVARPPVRPPGLCGRSFGSWEHPSAMDDSANQPPESIFMVFSAHRELRLNGPLLSFRSGFGSMLSVQAARMAKLADAQDLGSCGTHRAGSSPAPRTGHSFCGSSSVGRAPAFQAGGRGSESRLPLSSFFPDPPFPIAEFTARSPGSV